MQEPDSVFTHFMITQTRQVEIFNAKSKLHASLAKSVPKAYMAKSVPKASMAKSVLKAKKQYNLCHPSAHIGGNILLRLQM